MRGAAPLPKQRQSWSEEEEEEVEAKAVATGERLQAAQQPTPRSDTMQPLLLPDPQMPSRSDSSNFTLKAVFLWFIDQ